MASPDEDYSEYPGSPNDSLLGGHEDQLELFLGGLPTELGEDALDPSVGSPEALQAEMRIFLNPDREVTVRATPMELGEYLQLREWSPGKRTDLEAPGYLVERPDMGPPNQKGFEFFIAWLPKDNFEEFYEQLGVMNS